MSNGKHSFNLLGFIINPIKKLYKKWDNWQNQEVVINISYYQIITNNYTIELFILICLYTLIIFNNLN